MRPFALESWTKTPLANYSGTAIYEKSFLVPDSYHGRRLVLDLGRVSSVAEVYVNGQEAGTLVWRPYRLDITKFIKPGENQLKIRVTNTEANARAVGPSHRILANIDVCGLEGPVEIEPYIEQTLALKPEK
jgi:beta-galactosidase/beta-glucuronidase